MHWKSIIPTLILLPVLVQQAGAMERSELFTSYNFAEAVPDGIHHRIIFDHEETQGE
ncbi:MAG: hypothetical protein OES84_02170 [Kiritimatiellaceae bacterium]|nr:hypothetical protein [Kiritimatiellaceae bacterium]